MNNNLIRIFVNQNQLIEISKYSSVYSLKSKIHETIYSYESLDTVMNKFRINFNGKLLLDNKQTLISYGIDDNNNIDVEKNLEGGSWSSLFWLYLIYGICFYFFIILLISGLIPIIANLIGSIFENTLIRIIDYFTKGKNDATTKLMKNIVKFGLYILSFCFTIFFIWAFTSYAVFPFYYFKTNLYSRENSTPDKDIQELNAKIEYLKVTIDYLKECMQNITWRHQTIKNTIDWRKFMAGQ